MKNVMSAYIEVRREYLLLSSPITSVTFAYKYIFFLNNIIFSF